MGDALFLNDDHRSSLDTLCSCVKSVYRQGRDLSLALIEIPSLGYADLLSLFRGVSFASAPLPQSVHYARALSLFDTRAHGVFSVRFEQLASAGTRTKELRRCVTLFQACRETLFACRSLLLQNAGDDEVESFGAFRKLDSLLCAVDKLYCSIYPEISSVYGLRDVLVRRTPFVTSGVAQGFSDDVFLMQNALAPLIMLRLAKFLVPGGASSFVSLAVDDADLLDYRQLMAGTGTHMKRVFSFERLAFASHIVVERCELETATGRTLRCRDVLARASDDEWRRLLQTSSSLRLSPSDRFVAEYTGTRFVFADPRGARVTVDVDVSIYELNYSQVVRANGAFSAYQSATRVLVGRLPYSVVSVEFGSSPLKWVQKLHRMPDLQYAPKFNLHVASISVAQGDHLVEQLVPEEGTNASEQRLAELAALWKRFRKGVVLDGHRQGLEEQKGRVLFLNSSIKEDPKAYLTAERTLNSWVDTSIFVGLTVLVLLRVPSESVRYGGIAAAFVACVFAIYPLIRWFIRQRAIAHGEDLTPFPDRIGPAIAVVSISALMITLVVLSATNK